MRHWAVILGGAVTLIGCAGGDAAEELAECQIALKNCTPGAHSDSSAASASSGTTLTLYEAEILKDVLNDVRAGVRPYNDTGLGICPKHSDPARKRECEETPVRSPGELAAGEYILYSEWAVPDVGGKGLFQLVADVECVTTHTGKDGTTQTSTRSYKKEAEPVYAGKERGWRFSPLYQITSPNPSGPMSCTYTITSPHGDGDKVYEGAWTVPGPASE